MEEVKTEKKPLLTLNTKTIAAAVLALAVAADAIVNDGSALDSAIKLIKQVAGIIVGG